MENGGSTKIEWTVFLIFKKKKLDPLKWSLNASVNGPRTHMFGPDPEASTIQGSSKSHGRTNHSNHWIRKSMPTSGRIRLFTYCRSKGKKFDQHEQYRFHQFVPTDWKMLLTSHKFRQKKNWECEEQERFFCESNHVSMLHVLSFFFARVSDFLYMHNLNKLCNACCGIFYIYITFSFFLKKVMEFKYRDVKGWDINFLHNTSLKAQWDLRNFVVHHFVHLKPFSCWNNRYNVLHLYFIDLNILSII